MTFAQNVFVDRAPDFEATVYISGTVNISAGALPLPRLTPVMTLGQDAALCAFPLTSIFQTYQVTINDTSVTQNIDVVEVLQRMTDQRKNNLRRHCPYMLDTFQQYADGVAQVNSPLAGYGEATDYERVPNGAWFDVAFEDPDNAGQYTLNSLLTRADIVADAVNQSVPFKLRFRSSEKLFISPFIYADECEYDETGLYGINNINFVMNCKTDLSRVLRYAAGAKTVTEDALPLTINSLSAGFDASVDQNPAEVKLQMQFITPSLDLPLPAKNTVPYMEAPRYVQKVPVTVGTNVELTSNNVVLPNVPDLIAIYAKPLNIAAGAADFYLPINKVNLLWDNVQGLLSSANARQLFQMSVENGLRMDWNTWSGKARTAAGAKATVGSILVIKPGQNFALQSGLAPSVIGNFVLQYSLYVDSSLCPAGDYALYTVVFNSGFFQTMAGSSRIMKGVLSEADVLAAEPEYHKAELKRMVGHGFFSKLGSMLSKAVDLYSKSKPIVSGIKGMLPDEGALGKVKGALGKVGYGHVTGGAVTGGAAARRSLSDRLL